jgi:acetolactate synthase-1/2/3 large subunit
MKIKGNELVARALLRHKVDTLYFLMGGPTLGVAAACIDSKQIRMVDVRHEQAAAMMAHAHARLEGRPAICMASSGPGVANLVTGMANALADCAPVIALGGCSPLGELNTGYFQEMDQVAMMRPVTKWAERVHEARRLPEYIDMAFSHAMSGKPGPVYLDLPGDVLYAEVEEEDVVWPQPAAERRIHRPAAAPQAIAELMAMIGEARRPVILSGSGVFWSGACTELAAAVERLGIPFFTTPQGRGALPDDHPLSFPSARNTALREADLVIAVGTRLNYMWGYGKPPRFAKDAKFVRIDIDSNEIGLGQRVSLGVIGDAAEVLRQIHTAATGNFEQQRYADWRDRLATVTQQRQQKQDESSSNAATPIHPLRLCAEVREFMDRDAILVVDGAEILNYARQSIPTYHPTHRLNSGPFGTMGVGLPFALGAKVARPDKQVIVLHGDGSFGLNGMELDTALRHKLPVLVVISLNGGWSADPTRNKPGRELGYTRFDLMAQALGCHGEFVEKPEDIRGALERAAAEVSMGRPAVVNVVTDWNARSETANFTTYVT